MNVKPNTVSDWIKKGNSPKIENLYRISEFFGVSFDYLFTGKKNPSSEISEDEEKVLKYYRQLTAEDHRDYIKGEMVRLRMAEEANKEDVEFADELAK